MAKKRRNKSTGARAVVVDQSKGTPIWGYEQLRKDALVMLMIDLARLEERGLTRVQCDRVRKALEELSLTASAIGDQRLFQSTIRGKLLRFMEAYVKWNGHTGDDYNTRMRRRKALKVLGDRRQELAKVERRNWYILREEIDLTLVKQIYTALGAIITSMPEIFVNLSKSVTGITVSLGIDSGEGKV
jgi:hypothetical protein